MGKLDLIGDEYLVVNSRPGLFLMHSIQTHMMIYDSAFNGADHEGSLRQIFIFEA